jgi:hypothetical protein
VQHKCHLVAASAPLGAHTLGPQPMETMAATEARAISPADVQVVLADGVPQLLHLGWRVV